MIKSLKSIGAVALEILQAIVGMAWGFFCLLLCLAVLVLVAGVVVWMLSHVHFGDPSS